MSIDVVAPAPVASALTMSLSHQDAPRVTRVCAPQRWTRSSVSTAHPSQKRTSCTVAPRMLSTSAPVKPPRAIGTARLDAGRDALVHEADARPAMSPAPTADALRPATVTPPDAPGTVGRSVRIDRGREPERDPISVAQVSAVAVAT